MDDQTSPHAPTDDRVVRRLRTAWRLGVPAEASALHARWWQLETWLRDLVYVELKAKHGVAWGRRLEPAATQRSTREATVADYMPTADSHHVLAYLDIHPLFKLIEETEWEILAHAFPPLDVWRGRADELQTIRNRIGHCRRPHVDDLARVEQTLRDLETGAFRSVAAFNRQSAPDHDLDDPLVASWVRREHIGARRLIDHCESQYDVRFRLRYSGRPWAQPRPGSAVSGAAGYLWHANWTIGQGYFEARRFWSDLTKDVKDLLVFVAAPMPADVSVSFPAVDEPDRIADAIEHIFDGIIYSRGRRAPSSKEGLEIWDRWVDLNQGLDPRVAINSPWSIIDDSTTPVTLFGA
jgi:hypothetical protein